MDEKERLLRRLVELEERKLPRPLTVSQKRVYLGAMGGMFIFWGAVFAYTFWSAR